MSFKDLQEFNQFIKDSGFKLNDSGGEIKGSPKELLAHLHRFPPLLDWGEVPPIALLTHDPESPA